MACNLENTAKSDSFKREKEIFRRFLCRSFALLSFVISFAPQTNLEQTADIFHVSCAIIALHKSSSRVSSRFNDFKVRGGFRETRALKLDSFRDCKLSVSLGRPTQSSASRSASSWPKLIRRKAVRGILLLRLTCVFRSSKRRRIHKPPIKSVSLASN